MFFWSPTGTDAPIYYFPWATLTFVVLNVLVFVAAAAGQIPVDDWALNYGQIAPVEWVTSNFVHDGIGHLLGNMFFLWSIGLIVEGKLGWKSFSAVYLGIGIAECAIEQVCMLGAEGQSLGASSIIFGLMAIAMVWAPRNDISISYFFWLLFVVRVGSFDLSVIAYSLLVLVFELTMFALQGFHVGTSALHLIGAVLGFAIGVTLLKWEMVDCEGWDLFSVMKGTHVRLATDHTALAIAGPRTKSKKRRRNRKPSRILGTSDGEHDTGGSPGDAGLNRSEVGRRRILRHINDRKPRAAYTELRRQQHANPAFRLAAKPMRRLAAGLIEHEQWNDAITLLEEFLAHFDQRSDEIRLQLAILLLQKQRRPRAALAALQQIDLERLPAKLRMRLRWVQESADQMIDSGVVELRGRAFSSE